MQFVVKAIYSCYKKKEKKTILNIIVSLESFLFLINIITYFKESKTVIYVKTTINCILTLIV